MTERAADAFAAAPPAASVRCGKWLFLLSFCLYALTTSGRIEYGDGVVFYDMARSLAEHGTIRVDERLPSWGASPGRTYYTAGLAVAVTPFYWLGKLASVAAPAAAAERIRWLFVMLGASCFAALAAAAFFAVARRLGGGGRGALWATLLLLATTPLWSQSTVLTREPLASLLLLLAVGLLLPAERPDSRRRWLAAGAALVGAVWVRFELVVAAPFAIAYLAHSRWPSPPTRPGFGAARRAVGWFLLVPLLTAPVFLYFNLLKFGGWFDFGYAGHGHDLTATPLWIGLAGLLASPMHGLLFYAPAVAFGVWGWGRLRERDRSAWILLAALPAFLLVFYAKFSVWSGANSVGPRFLLPALSLALLPAALTLNRRSLGPSGAAAAILVALYGAAVQLVLVLGDWTAFFGRLTVFWGGDGVPPLPNRFLVYPPLGFAELIGEGRLGPIWLNLAAGGLPAWLGVLPFAFAPAAIAAAAALWRASGASAPPAKWRSAPRARRRAFVAAGAAVWLLAGLLTAERIAWPRGLEMRLYGEADATRPALTVGGQRPAADLFANPFARLQPPAATVEWRGWLRVPSHIPALDSLRLVANSPASVTLGDRVAFQATLTPEQREVNVVRRLELARGYHPATVRFLRPPDDPYFTLRWTLHDYAYQAPIPRDCLFAAEPSPLGKALIEAEFYLRLGLLVALFFLLRATAALRFREPHDPDPA